MTIEKNEEKLRSIFNRISSVGMCGVNLQPSKITTITYMLPIIEDSVDFNMGEEDIENIKLTTGKVWTSFASQGEPEITMNCGSLDSALSNLFQTAKSGAETISNFEGVNYTGFGYSSETKKVKSGLLFRSEDKAAVIYLPNCEIYATLVVESDSPAYYQLKVTPLSNTNGVNMYIMFSSSSSTQNVPVIVNSETGMYIGDQATDQTDNVDNGGEQTQNDDNGGE